MPTRAGGIDRRGNSAGGSRGHGTRRKLSLPMSKRKKHARVEEVFTPTHSRFDPLPWFMGAALVILVILVYRPAVSGQFVGDDDEYVVDNEAVRSPGGLADIWLRPTASPR